MNQILTEPAGSIRLHDDMSEGFWAEAVNHASYQVNKSPSIAVDLQISWEIWWGQPVNYSPYGFSVVQRIIWLSV